MDPRETPFNGHVAHVSLKGKVEAERFVAGEAMQVAAPQADLVAQPQGRRERQLLMGEGFLALEAREDWTFGMARRDGYVGYLATSDLEPESDLTHLVGVARTHAKAVPDLKTTEPVTRLSFGAIVEAGRTDGPWVAVRIGGAWLWAPERHLRRAGVTSDDPASVAELFLHTPYLWGGNSAFGIDCSGLVQAALLACGIPCPGDSDQQEARAGTPLPPDTCLARNDLVFWKGHVAIALDAETIIHANAHHMSVAIEPLETARARIAASGDGAVTSVRRP